MSSERRGVIPHTVQAILTAEYADRYETVSATDSRPYENNARRLARRLPSLNGKVVLEICAGTGNSSIVLLEERPEIEQLITVDANSRFMEIAAYKFGSVDKVTNGFSEQSIEYRGEMKYRAAQLGKKPGLVLGRADGGLLPIKSNSADVIFGASAMHWLAFEQAEVSDTSYLSGALDDFKRVLSRGGLLAFDVSGLQFDFEDETLGGRHLNSYHMTGHPFHLAFLENVFDITRQRGFRPPEFVDFGSFDRYYHIFSSGHLLRLAEEFGFEIIPDTGKPYGLSMELLPANILIERVRDGARMRCFNNPELQNLTEQQKVDIINSAFDRTMRKNADLLSQDSAEMQITFLFELRRK